VKFFIINLLYYCLVTLFFIEPVDEGTEQTLKLRLSTTLGEVKLPVYSNDTIGIAKKKLQVCTILCI
jgi:hypothetical protein